MPHSSLNKSCLEDIRSPLGTRYYKMIYPSTRISSTKGHPNYRLPIPDSIRKTKR